MNKMTKIAAFIGVALVASGANAADWNVTQSADITVPAPSMTQGATSNVASSNQALNGIVIDAVNDDLASGTQTTIISSSTGVDLTQGPSVDASNQALNLIIGKDVGSVSTISQTVSQTDFSTTALTQADTSSAGANVQAANLTDATGDIDRLVQNYDEVGNVNLTQSTMTTSGNVQGINYAKGVNVATSNLTQSVNVSGVSSMTQGAGNSGGNNTQIGNAAIATTGSLDLTTQTFTAAADLTLTQAASGASNVQATNLMKTESGGNIGDSIGSTTQTTTIASGPADFSQTVSASGNVQAGNFASSDADISDLTQTFEASGALEVDFDQTPTAAANTQAGNMAVLATGTGDFIDEISQVFNSSTTLTDLNQVSASSTLTQAGNLIDITTGTIDDSGTTQLFTALGGAVTMNQSGAGAASGNLQALNAIVDNAGAGSGGTVNQVLTIASTSFSMVQDNISGSGQYGNFVGVKY
ncbi:beta strand repeat-containing protein [Arenicella xantha]|uniref:Curlin associated repeat-containing protein n=1 Tax=Arenicella xantha TaxID=644221 RepID=A0A395JNT8_9GAMM|nr:hypothetical protein [Arenicella xantha]RBP51224.1 hypothetical protein DFR28_102643 [Arenicella xantha]